MNIPSWSINYGWNCQRDQAIWSNSYYSGSAQGEESQKTKSKGTPTFKSDAGTGATNMVWTSTTANTANPLKTANYYQNHKWGSNYSTKWQNIVTRPDSEEKNRFYEGEFQRKKLINAGSYLVFKYSNKAKFNEIIRKSRGFCVNAVNTFWIPRGQSCDYTQSYFSSPYFSGVGKGTPSQETKSNGNPSWVSDASLENSYMSWGNPVGSPAYGNPLTIANYTSNRKWGNPWNSKWQDAISRPDTEEASYSYEGEIKLRNYISFINEVFYYFSYYNI